MAASSYTPGPQPARGSGDAFFSSRSSPDNARAIPSVQEYFSHGGIETLDYLHAKLGDDGYEAYLIGMVHKKLHKAFFEPPATRSKTYEKAAVYMARLLAIKDATIAASRPHQMGSDSILPQNFSRLSLTPAAAGDSTNRTAANAQPPLHAAQSQSLDPQAAAQYAQLGAQ